MTTSVYLHLRFEKSASANPDRRHVPPHTHGGDCLAQHAQQEAQQPADSNFEALHPAQHARQEFSDLQGLQNSHHQGGSSVESQYVQQDAVQQLSISSSKADADSDHEEEELLHSVQQHSHGPGP